LKPSLCPHFDVATLLGLFAFVEKSVLLPRYKRTHTHKPTTRGESRARGNLVLSSTTPCMRSMPHLHCVFEVIRSSSTSHLFCSRIFLSSSRSGMIAFRNTRQLCGRPLTSSCTRFAFKAARKRLWCSFCRRRVAAIRSNFSWKVLQSFMARGARFSYEEKPTCSLPSR